MRAPWSGVTRDRELGAVRAGDEWDTTAKANGRKVLINEV